MEYEGSRAPPSGCGPRSLRSLREQGSLRGARCWRRWRGSRLCGEPAFSAGTAGRGCGPAGCSQVPSDSRCGRRRAPSPSLPLGRRPEGSARTFLKPLLPRLPALWPLPPPGPVRLAAAGCRAAPGSPCSACGQGPRAGRCGSGL